jgi:hypothetical protein
MESRLDVVESRFDVVESRFDVVESRFDVVDSSFVVVDSKFDAVDSRLIAFIADVICVTIASFENPRCFTNSALGFSLNRVRSTFQFSDISSLEVFFSLFSHKSLSDLLSTDLSSSSERWKSSGSVTAVEMITLWLLAFLLLKCTILPPNPNFAPTGHRSHFGGCLREKDGVYGAVIDANGSLLC